MEKKLHPKYQIGDVVFLKTDTDQYHRIVTAICIRVTGIQYELGFGHSSSWHYDIEITKDKDILTKILND